MELFEKRKDYRADITDVWIDGDELEMNVNTADALEARAALMVREARVEELENVIRANSATGYAGSRLKELEGEGEQ